MNVLKWPGGKRQLVPRLLPLVLKHLGQSGAYVEPFVGGGALAFALPERVSVRAGDAEADLVTFYRVVARTPLSVARRVQEHAASHCAEYYYAVRASTPVDAVDKAARFVYLNRACFNGLHRKNASGKFNVPIGKGTPRFPSTGELVILSRRLRTWSLWEGDFYPLLARARRGDVIFADPPYDGTFTSYTTDGFTAVDQLRLSTSLHGAYARGVSVLATNADTPLIRTLYGSWSRVEAIDEKRRIAADVTRRGPAACVLIAALHS